MKFTYKHRKTVAVFTLISVVVVLTLALNFTVFGAFYCEEGFEENILITDDNMDHCVLSPEICPLNAHIQSKTRRILPLDLFSLYVEKCDLFFITVLVLLLLTAEFDTLDTNCTLVSLHTRMDQ